MNEPPSTRRDRGQTEEVFEQLKKIIIDGLQHGFFPCSIECEMGSGRNRHLVIRAGKSQKYIIREDELPR